MINRTRYVNDFRMMTGVSPRAETPRLTLRDERRETLRSVASGGPVPLPDPGVIQVWFRLPFQIGVDDRSHVYPLAREYSEASGSADYWRGQGAPWVQVSVHNVPAPWRSVLRPGLVRGLRGLLGESAVGDPTVSDEPDPPADGYDTWVSAITPAVPLDGESDLLEGCLERGIFGINRLLRAYRFISEDPYVRTIALEDLDPLLPWRVAPADGDFGALAMVPLHANVPVFPDRLDADRLQKLDTIINMQGQHHPFTLYREWLERAKHERQDRGDPTSAVIALQTAVESLLFNMLVMLRIDEGAPSADVVAMYEDEIPFKTLLTQRFRPLLGGNWSLERGPVANYWQQLYLVRNRIVHAGKQATYAEMDDAFDAYGQLNDFLVNRIHAHWRRYPRTLVAYLGQPGLARRGWLNPSVQELLDRLAAEELPFWLPADVRARSASTST